jgi:hypothetical protein
MFPLHTVKISFTFISLNMHWIEEWFKEKFWVLMSSILFHRKMFLEWADFEKIDAVRLEFPVKLGLKMADTNKNVFIPATSITDL